MPHLSPVLWLVVVFMFLSVLMVLISCMWWAQLPSFNVKGSGSTLMQNYWGW